MENFNEFMHKHSGLNIDFEAQLNELEGEAREHLIKDMYWSLHKGKAFEEKECNVTFDEFVAMIDGGESETPVKPAPPVNVEIAAGNAANSMNNIEGYTPAGDFAADEAGNTTYTIDAAEIVKNQKAIVNDYARYLGQLHNEGVDVITYNDTEYAWDPEGKLKGSNFKAGDVTLMSVVTADLMAGKTSPADLNGTTIAIGINGKEYTTTIVVTEQSTAEVNP